MEERRDGKKQRSRGGKSGKRSRGGKRTIPEKNIISEKKVSSGKGIQTEKGNRFGNCTGFEKSIRFIKDTGRSLSLFLKRAAERIPRPILIGGLITVVVLIGILLFLGRGSSTEVAEVSAGQKDNIQGFMFIFDRRSVQQRLVVDMKEGRVPLKLTCEKIDLIPNDDGTVVEKVDESATLVSEDSDFIKKVYQEMTDMIVIGQIPMRDNTTRCRITMVLQDGTDCIFTFDTVSVIEIEGQDYMMESDGGLWKLLPGFF